MAVRGSSQRILVVGGGPAGSVAATLLARGGRDVTLVEAARFPRDKVCGECLSDLGWQVLKRHGLDAPLTELRPVPLQTAVLCARGGGRAELDLPHPMHGVTRRLMDVALLDAARNSGVSVVQPGRVEAMTGTRATLRIDGERQDIDFDLVVLADGKGTLSGAAPRRPPTPSGDLGVKVHFEAGPGDAETIGLYGLRGHYVGTAPASDGDRRVLNVAMSVPAAKVRRFASDFDALLVACCEENPAFGCLIGGRERLTKWHASPLPRFAPRRPQDWPPGVIPVGNAAAALEPVGGEGMGLAIASAELAAAAILRGEVPETLAAAYRRLWRTRRAACRAAAVALSTPFAGGAVVTLARLLPLARTVGLHLIGKRGEASFPASGISAATTTR